MNLNTEQINTAIEIFEALLIRRRVTIDTGTAQREIRVSTLTVDDMDAVNDELPNWSEFLNTLVQAGHLSVIETDERYIIIHREMDIDTLLTGYQAFLQEESDRETKILQMQDVMPCHGTEYIVHRGDKTFRRFDENMSLATLLSNQLHAEPIPQAVRLF